MKVTYKNFEIRTVDTVQGLRYEVVAPNGTPRTDHYVTLGAARAMVDFLTTPRPTTPEDAAARHKMNARKLGRRDLDEFLV